MRRHLGGGQPVVRAPVGLGRQLAMIAGALAAMIALVLTASPAGAQLPGLEGLPAPATTLSADGTSATDGVRTLSVSQAYDLDPSGQTLVVSGQGYDDFKGVYVAFCLVPPTNELPSPCGGGIAIDGSTGASQWISSNPPPAGVGLAIPYGPGGSFEVVVDVGPVINNSIDCRRVSCAIVTRNDHVRTIDRSQDIFVPVTFASSAAPVDEQAVEPEAPAAPGASTQAPDPAAVAPVDDTTTTAPPTTTTVPPTFELESADGPDGGSSSSALPLVLGGVAAVALVAGAGTWFVLSRRSAGPGT